MSNKIFKISGNKDRHGGHIARLKIMNKDMLDALNKILKIMNKMEFFDIENFSSLQNFPDKTYTYQLFFNLVRPDAYKENKTPWILLKKKNPDLRREIYMLPPIIPDNMINRGYINSVYHLCPAPFFIFLSRNDFS